MNFSLFNFKKQGLWIVFFLSISIPFFAAELTAVDNDGYILFSYALKDAENSSANSNSIKLFNIEDVQKYLFQDHVLSCGTHLLGFIQKEKYNNLIRYYAAFTIHKNPYKIRKLIIDYSIDDRNVKKGDIIIDDKKIDINKF